VPRPDAVPISALEHHAYCPRQCALIHVDGVWVDSVHTLRGTRGHRRVDAGPSRLERGRRVLRAVPLWSEELGLSGRADVVEITHGGVLVPVEYKMGTRHGNAAELQLCAQALCLEEMTARRVPEGALWLAGPRRRIAVQIDEQLRRMTLRAIEEMREYLRGARLPPPVHDERCRECQLIGYCLPDVVAQPARVISYLRNELACVF
jgi:CRISPR-associated exonuclease Cas4